VEKDMTENLNQSLEGLRQKAVTGVIWSSFMQFSQLGIRFLVMVLLARLLGPKDFGLIGMVTIFTGFAALFNELGLGSALIQRQDIESRHLNSVFWLNVAAGCIFTLLFIAVSPFIASFYAEPMLVPLTSVVALSFVIGALNVVQNALMNKHMDFRRLAIINVSAVFIAGITAVAMALAGFGVWSLVANQLIIVFVSASLMWRLSDWRPQLEWDSQAIRELFGFSANLVGFRIINYWTNNADNLFIGKFINAVTLGIYGRASEFRILPLALVSWILDKVMFPALSMIQADKVKVKQVFLRANRTIALITFPMMMGLCIVARPFILTVYGDKWEAVVLILQIFCIEAMGRSIMTTIGWIYLSQGRTDIQLRWEIFAGIVRLIAILIGLHWGAAGVAAAWTITFYAVIWYPGWLIPGRLIDLRPHEALRNVASIFFCSLLMAAALVALGHILPSGLPQWTSLIVQVPFGIVIYGILIHILKVRAYVEVRELAAEQWRLRYEKPAKLEPMV
jgi:PST family polysaccharide transporter